jgi:hypothetical protein
MSFSPTKRLGSEASRLSQIQDGQVEGGVRLRGLQRPEGGAEEGRQVRYESEFFQD